MALPESRLGIPIPAGFDPDAFRNAITFAEQMGAPPDPDRRPKFLKASGGHTYWRDGTELTTLPRMGRDRQPLDPNIEVRETPPVEVTDANVAIEIDRADSEELPVGNFRQTKAIVTALDVDYAKIEGCKEMVYNGDRYLFGYEPEAMGLFSVGIHTIIYYALDDS